MIEIGRLAESDLGSIVAVGGDAEHGRPPLDVARLQA